MKITIRPAKAEDANQVAEAEREIAKNPGFFCSQPFELTDQTTAEAIAECTKTGVYFVAEHEGNIVGHAFLEPLRCQSLHHVAELNIVVHQGWQEKGIGKQLMEKLIEWAKNSSTIEKIELKVRASNTRAISLYKKMGFREEGRLKKRVKVKDRYFDDLIMALDLKENHQKDNIILREMKEEDINVLVNTFSFPWEPVQEATEKWQRYFAEQQKHIRTVCLLETENQLTGYGSLVRASEYPLFQKTNIPEIHDLWISEEKRNRGFGKAIILHLENVALSEGYEQIGIGVGLNRDYGPAQRLYIRMGYIPDGMGLTYKYAYTDPGERYRIDDDLIIWLKKSLLES